MRYYVIGMQGEKYGPADAATLQQWVNEGRILPTHQLEIEGTMTRLPATAVPGLVFPIQGYAPGPAAPYAAPMYPPQSYLPSGQGRIEALLAWALIGASFLCGCGLASPVPYADILCALGAVGIAYRAQNVGHSSGRTLVAIAWLTLIWALARIAMMRFGMGLPGL